MVVADADDYVSPNGRQIRQVVGRCACGSEKIFQLASLRGRSVVSCGCYRAEMGYGSKRPETAVKYLFRKYRQGAVKRGYCFDISLSVFADVIRRDCFYCGARPCQVVKTKQGEVYPFSYNGIDRVNNTSGYIVGNVQPCCAVCNRAKMARAVSEFETWILRAADNIRNRRAA